MYEVKIGRKYALPFFDSLPEKSQRIVREHIDRLKINPFPGRGGDKERLVIDGYVFYRMAVARSYTVFYRIFRERRKVLVLDIMTAEEAHKRYGRFSIGEFEDID